MQDSSKMLLQYTDVQHLVYFDASHSGGASFQLGGHRSFIQVNEGDVGPVSG